ncbi:hypothetical protein ACIBO2_56315 [Nonomuraea sp. NPDC050022]|uniref:hypothetical protein n=1 Tax=unclassified Nonomuraea TaxID=2593643 RepID=UPI0033C4E34E
MRNTPRIVAVTTVLAAATAPLLALSSPAMAEQPAKTVQSAQSLPLSWLSLQGLTESAHLQRIKQLLGTGYVPSALSVTNAANPEYTSVWVKDATRKVNVLQDLSVTDLPKRITEQQQLGFQPTMITGTGAGTGAIFAAVFEKTTRKLQSKTNLTKEALATVNTQLGAAGYQISSLDVYGTAEKPLYTAVWAAGAVTGTLQVTTGQTVEQRGRELLARAKQGLSPVAMAIEPGKLYTTVWGKANSTGLKEYLQLSSVTYKLKSLEMKGLGYHPIVTNVEDNVYAGIWSKN